MVSEKVTLGLNGQRQTVVCQHNVAKDMERFSTPSMILLMEEASVAAFHQFLEPHQTSVGYVVDIRHLAPALLGAKIVAYAELTGIVKNKLTFNVEAYDGDTKIGEGTHRRAIIGKEPGILIY